MTGKIKKKTTAKNGNGSIDNTRSTAQINDTKSDYKSMGSIEDDHSSDRTPSFNKEPKG